MKETVLTLKVHVSLNVKDISESIEFYRKLFAVSPTKVRKGYAKFDVENPPLNLALNEARFSEENHLSHLGIQVSSTEDVLMIKKRWEEAGLVTKDEMQTNCCYALQDKTWTTDPDGIEWEVFVVLEDNLPETNMCCISENTRDSLVQNSDTINQSCCNPQPNSTSVNSETQITCC